MNYEQKYREALEKIRNLSNDFKRRIPKDVFEDMETYLNDIFPELKESEDERIRKEIIKTVELYGPKTGDPKVYNDMLVWLEKQGEKPY